MKFNKLLILLLIIALIVGCGGGGGGSSSSTPETVTAPETVTTVTTPTSGSSSGTTSGTSSGSSSTPAAALAVNVLPITVNGSLCAADSYPNKLCVSVTVCAPGTVDCQTITDILLDTGSFGLRIFKELLPAALQQSIGASGLAECVQFSDGSTLWGAVQVASIILGGEPAVSAPMHVIDASFGTRTLPTHCANASQLPSDAGYNGILGVGLFIQDCAACVNSSANGRYYTCDGSTCSGTAVSLARQVQNPVALLPLDNNGVIVQLPGVPLGGTTAVDGNLVLGIDTRANNTSAGATVYATDQDGYFTTTFNGRSYRNSFIDSGSNGLFFSTSLLPSCTGGSSGWYCPSPAPVSLSATNTFFSGVASKVDFQIGNADNLFTSTSSNKVFVEIGGSFPAAFDWGLPFFFGRNVHAGFEGKKSRLGTGPYWAY